jgi:hypothetical protein
MMFFGLLFFTKKYKGELNEKTIYQHNFHPCTFVNSKSREVNTGKPFGNIISRKGSKRKTKTR